MDFSLTDEQNAPREVAHSISCDGLGSAPVLLGGSQEVRKIYLGMLTEAPMTGGPERRRATRTRRF